MVCCFCMALKEQPYFVFVLLFFHGSVGAANFVFCCCFQELVPLRDIEQSFLLPDCIISMLIDGMAAMHGSPLTCILEIPDFRFREPQGLTHVVEGLSHIPSSVISHQSPVISHQSSVISHRLSVDVHQSPVITARSSLSVVVHPSSVISHRP